MWVLSVARIIPGYKSSSYLIMYHCSSSSGFPHWICVSFRGTAFGNFLLKLRCCLLMQSSSRLLQQRPVPPYPAQKEQNWVWGPALATCITETSGCVACRLSSTGFRCFHIAAGLLCLDGDIVLKQVGSWFPPRHKTPCMECSLLVRRSKV